MYYVLYSPSRKMYLNSDNEWGSFEQAVKSYERYDAVHSMNYYLDMVDAESDIKVVGPCKEGEER